MRVMGRFVRAVEGAWGERDEGGVCEASWRGREVSNGEWERAEKKEMKREVLIPAVGILEWPVV